MTQSLTYPDIKPVNSDLPASAQVSFVVPIYNEVDNIEPLLKEMTAVGDSLGVPYEMVLVDDGSTDGTPEKAETYLHALGQRLKLVKLARNYGQSGAMACGFHQASGQLIVSLDGDLQNDPHDVPEMIRLMMDKNLDMVIGWRRNRQDKVLTRKIPSYIANRIIGWLTGYRFTDYGCSLKVTKAEFAKTIPLYGEMHRFIPFLAAMEGAKVQEMPVNHRARIHGVSKYNLSRTLKVVMDLITLIFIRKFYARPLHMFGRLGFYTGVSGVVMLAFLVYEKYALGQSIGHRPALTFGVLLILAGMQFVCTGLLAEIQVRTAFNSGQTLPYRIRSVQTGQPS